MPLSCIEGNDGLIFSGQDSGRCGSSSADQYCFPSTGCLFLQYLSLVEEELFIEEEYEGSVLERMLLTAELVLEVDSGAGGCYHKQLWEDMVVEQARPALSYCLWQCV